MLFRTFINKKHYIEVSKAKGINIYSKSGKKYTDLTGGITGHAILGWGNKKIISSVNNQIKKFGHIDYKFFKDNLYNNIIHELSAVKGWDEEKKELEESVNNLKEHNGVLLEQNQKYKSWKIKIEKFSFY